MYTNYRARLMRKGGQGDTCNNIDRFVISRLTSLSRDAPIYEPKREATRRAPDIKARIVKRSRLFDHNYQDEFVQRVYRARRYDEVGESMKYRGFIARETIDWYSQEILFQNTFPVFILAFIPDDFIRTQN